MPTDEPLLQPAPTQLPVGTHGLTDASGTELGKLVVRDGRETWIWRTDGAHAAFPSTFKMTIGGLPSRAARGAEVFEYVDQAFNGDRITHDVPYATGDLLYRITVPDSPDPKHLGYLSLGATGGATLVWYSDVVTGSPRRIDVAANDVLTFAALTAKPANYLGYKESISRILLMQG